MPKDAAAAPGLMETLSSMSAADVIDTVKGAALEFEWNEERDVRQRQIQLLLEKPNNDDT